MNRDIFQRTEIVLGKEAMDSIIDKHVVICGVGGVGSFVVEALARIGVGKITIIDKDVVDITNINRQIIALTNTVGKNKVEVAKERIHNINPDITVNAIMANITKVNIDEFININENIDYVVDCVDNVDAKIAIILQCHQENIPCISCMGMGNKLNPLAIRVNDIYKTTTCPLARVVRKQLKALGIYRQKVVFSLEEPIKNHTKDNTLGSVSFVPSTAGLIMASEVVRDLLGKFIINK
ncbi:MAG: tRNA threonylcarbamoyladenosine dehydratase [Clostridia bacterium]|nr:tRNA threonylcarbamoyladenosine dehydratase [Clostridia bacterium]